MILYLFSGLGADKRVYADLNLSEYEVHHIEWLIPEHKESIEEYAKRLVLSNQIMETDSIFIGLSFGGIMAIEVAKHIKQKRIILISSVKNQLEIPFYFRWSGRIGLHKLIPKKRLTSTNFIMNYFFGIKKNKDKDLLSGILQDTNPYFVRWAIDKIISWKNLNVFEHLIHIHGTEDRIFPIKYSKPDIIIKGGGHFMIVDQSKEIENSIIEIVEKSKV